MLELNTLGDPESRAAYRDALVDYYPAHAASFREDSRRGSSAIRCASSIQKDEGDKRDQRGCAVLRRLSERRQPGFLRRR